MLNCVESNRCRGCGKHAVAYVKVHENKAVEVAVMCPTGCATGCLLFEGDAVRVIVLGKPMAGAKGHEYCDVRYGCGRCYGEATASKPQGGSE